MSHKIELSVAVLVDDVNSESDIKKAVISFVSSLQQLPIFSNQLLKYGYKYNEISYFSSIKGEE